MTISQGIQLAFFLVIIGIGIYLVISTKRRYEKTTESAALQKLRCKKDEINAIMGRLVNYASRTKAQIKILWDNGIIDEELNQLKIVLAQYNEIKVTLTTEQLEHEREDYNKAVSNITKLFGSLREVKEEK